MQEATLPLPKLRGSALYKELEEQLYVNWFLLLRVKISL